MMAGPETWAIFPAAGTGCSHWGTGAQVRGPSSAALPSPLARAGVGVEQLGHDLVPTEDGAADVSFTLSILQ